MTDTFTRLRPHVAALAFLPADSPRVTAEASLDDLGLDSLDRVELVLAVEAAFDITTTDDEAENLRSVADLIRLVEAKQKDAA